MLAVEWQMPRRTALKLPSTPKLETSVLKVRRLGFIVGTLFSLRSCWVLGRLAKKWKGRGMTTATNSASALPRNVGCWPRQSVTHAEERCGEVAFVDQDLWLQRFRNTDAVMCICDMFINIRQ